jgi:hypothetical protein
MTLYRVTVNLEVEAEDKDLAEDLALHAIEYGLMDFNSDTGEHVLLLDTDSVERLEV